MTAKIAGIVIAYFPDAEKLKFNIESYIDRTEQLFIVINSSVSLEEVNRIQSWDSKIQLVCNKENIGIASALNQIAQKVLNLGYDWLLTMDQDSYFKNLDFFEAFDRGNKINVAIFSPNSIPSEIKAGNIDDNSEVLNVITSGNLLNLEIWRSLGGFEEKLFIDEVDNDYCLKAVSNGSKIISFKNCHLVHELGKNKEVSILNKKLTIITHTPIRAYYIFRNSLYIFNKYEKEFPEFVRSRKIILLKVFIKILLFSPERIKNFRYIIRGVKDYFNNSYGCYVGKSSKHKKTANILK